MEDPLISVIVPVYNAGNYLRRCLDSILGQTYTNIELLLIDDGSTDGSADVCDEYAARDSRVKVFHKSNGGVSAARNHGIDATRGEYIAFCDNDDFYAPVMLERLLGMCLDNDCEIAQCLCERGQNENIPVPERQPVRVFTGREMLESIYDNGTSYIWDKLYQRHIFDGIRFPEGSYMHEDIMVAHRLYGATKRIAATRERLYYHYRNPASVVGSGFNLRWVQDDPFADRLEYARNGNLPRLYASTSVRRFLFEGYLLIMNRKYNRDARARRQLNAERRKLYRNYYRNAVRAEGVSFKDKLFITVRRYAPPLFHLYNYIKWRMIRGDNYIRWGEIW